ncbi:oxidoreductase [Verminephrobacter eiseniae]|uniref:PDR/VanB family oxidoreductase n=1 Tax=Verminephrobacter eiseniae TaxID=364317 RepID=UPI002238720E|nr:PDR/VanB family oxidoreductase [Verminephrobacter eiseniae]MCW5258947.1 oxidoreductase [Verminephrobacter eiseniae]
MHNDDRISVRARSLVWEAEGVISVELVHVDGVPLPAFEAGAHVDLHLPNRLTRSYSLCSRPGDVHRYVLGIGLDRASRGGSRWVHEQLRAGALLEISAPRNHFRLDEAAPAFALIAGGIGVTPILAMAQRLAELRKPVRMLYAVRHASAAAFTAELHALVPELTLHIDSEASLPPDLAGWLARLPRDTSAYCCGPAPMLDAFEAASARLGLADARVERFSAPVVSAASTVAPYTVVLQRSGRSVDVAPGISILHALMDQGIQVPYSCMAGACGTCETRVLDGEVEHRDSVLTPSEKARGDVMMVCVSGSKGQRLVLDL